MAIEVTLPDLGEDIESGDVLTIHVSEGDTVEEGQPILELEAGKSTMDIPSTASGKVTKVHVSQGDSIASGSVLVTLESSDAGSGSSESPPEESPAKQEESAESTEPANEQAPAQETEEEPQAEPEPAEEPAPAQPAPTQATPKPSEAPKPVMSTPSPPLPPVQEPTGERGEVVHEDADNVPAGPAVRRFAREVGVDLRMVRGSGPGGRVTRDDVLLTVRQLSQNGGSQAATSVAQSTTAEPKADSTTPPPIVAPSGESGEDKYGPVRIEKMRKIRKMTAAQMTSSWTTVPRVTNFDDADVTALEELRQQSKADYAEAGVKLTSMPFLIKAVALALRDHPELNASIDLENEQIIYKEYVNVGIAVDSERGLVVPNIRNTDRMSIPDIARTLQQTAADIRGNSFSTNQLQGGTFTISNLGAIGGTYSTPIINIPEVAILLVGRSRMMPVVVDGQIVPRLMMPMSLSYDHRLVDGATAARFLNEVISYLEAPSRLLMAP